MTVLTLNFPPSLKLSEKQFATLAMANRDIRLELTVTGDLAIMPPTGGETGNYNAELNGQLWYWNSRTRFGKVFDSSTGFRLPNGAIRSPDLAWIPLEKWDSLSSKQQETFLPLCPDFTLELVSKTDREQDTKAKMQEYLDNGLRLGWLIIPKTRTVEIYRPKGEIEILDSPSSLSGENILPEFWLDLRWLW